MSTTSEKQLLFSIIKFLEDLSLKNSDNTESMNVCIQCLQDQFNIDVHDPEQVRQLGVCPSLLELFTKNYPAQESANPELAELESDSRFQQFINNLLNKGYFKGTDIHDFINKERLEKAILKFKEKYGNTTTSPVSIPTQNEEKTVTEEEENQAESLKEQGNNCLVQKDYDAAINCYSRAIYINPRGEKSHIYYGNRAAAYMYLKQYDSAIEDCKTSIELCPSYIRAYTRLATIYITNKDTSKAREIISKGLEIDPNNKGLLDGLQTINNQSSSSDTNPSSNASSNASSGLDFSNIAGMLRDPNVQQNITNNTPNNNMNTPNNNPNNTNSNPLGGLSGLLNNPEVMNMAQNLMRDPQAMNNLMGTFGSLFGSRGGNSNNNNNSNN
ncbi:hypothetical protein WA158_007390 [Blastocystis sp. Blastoise]